jgi:hypothetical protein
MPQWGCSVRCSIGKAILLVLCWPALAFAAWDGAIIKSIDPQANGLVHVGVVLTDSSNGQASFQDFTLDGATLDGPTLAAFVQARVANLNGAITKSKALTPGASISLTPVTVAPVQPTPPTAEQQFFLDLAQLASVNKALGLGFVDASDATYAALLKKVQQEFQTAYVNDRGWPTW